MKYSSLIKAFVFTNQNKEGYIHCDKIYEFINGLKFYKS